MSNKPKIFYFLAIFPALTETFVQREVSAFIKAGANIHLFAIWKGDREFNGHSVSKYNLWRLLTLSYWIPYWMLVNPKALIGIFEELWNRPVPYWKNWQEVFLGLGFGITEARKVQIENPNIMHGVWATLPSTAALTISELTGIPFSMGAHAYDIFTEGGDWLLDYKRTRAKFVRTSSRSSLDRLIELGFRKEKIHLIRRSLPNLPAARTRHPFSQPLQFLSVGRLTPKKGYYHQLDIYKQLQIAGIQFEAKIVGGGALHSSLQKKIDSLGLSKQVVLQGDIPSNQVASFYKQADFFIFTGIIAPDGDRDGFPNVLAEAMAQGCLVLSSNVADVCSAIKDEQTGHILDVNKPTAWVARIQKLLKNPNSVIQQRSAARLWVEENFNPEKNTSKFLDLLSQ